MENRIVKKIDGYQTDFKNDDNIEGYQNLNLDDLTEPKKCNVNSDCAGSKKYGLDFVCCNSETGISTEITGDDGVCQMPCISEGRGWCPNDIGFENRHCLGGENGLSGLFTVLSNVASTIISDPAGILSIFLKV